MGVSRYLHEHHGQARIIGVEPRMGHAIQGLKNMQEAICPQIYNAARLDEKIVVTDEDAFQTTRLLARSEGLFVGMSSGAAVAGALQWARSMRRGCIVALLPDRGDRYLSTGVFEPPIDQSRSRVA